VNLRFRASQSSAARLFTARGFSSVSRPEFSLVLPASFCLQGSAYSLVSFPGPEGRQILAHGVSRGNGFALEAFGAPERVRENKLEATLGAVVACGRSVYVGLGRVFRPEGPAGG